MSGTLALIDQWRKSLPSEPPHGGGVLAVPVSMGELFVLADMVRKDERAKALQAAREAVAALVNTCTGICCSAPHNKDANDHYGRALAAIDALRGES